jgi:hypothetical protein
VTDIVAVIERMTCSIASADRSAAAPSPRTRTATGEIDTNHGAWAFAPGKTAKATVTGFKADQQVTVRLTSAKGRKLAKLTTSSTGSGTATVTFPASTKAGTYQVYAIGAGQPTATATIKVS